MRGEPPGAVPNEDGPGGGEDVLPGRRAVALTGRLAAEGCGGGPWEIIGATLTTIHPPQLVDWTLEGTGTSTRLRAGDVFELELAPLTNPVTGEPFQAIVQLPSGFVSRQLEHSSSRTFRVGGPIGYQYPGRDAAFGPFAYEGHVSA